MAKYYRQKPIEKCNYHFGGTQPCWNCKKAGGGCCWSQSFIPVPGWEAVPHYIKSNGEFAETYTIKYCPEFERE